MTEVRFYHLQQDTTAKAVADILLKALDKGMKILLKVPDSARVAFYDDWLWRFREDRFLPHGCDGDPHESAHPVWISTNDTAPNNADMAMIVEDATLPPLENFQLVCLVFDSENPDRLQRARALWADLKTRPALTLTYWQQQENGVWSKKDV